MRLSGSTDNLLTAASVASKFIPGAQPLSVALSVASTLTSVFGGQHVVRPKHYADFQFYIGNVKLINAYGNSDAKHATSLSTNVAAQAGQKICAAINELTASFHGTIPKAISVGFKYMAKYQTLDMTLNRPITKEAPFDLFEAKIQNDADIQNLTASAFYVLVKKGQIILPDVIKQQLLTSNFHYANAKLILQQLYQQLAPTLAQSSQIQQDALIQSQTQNSQFSIPQATPQTQLNLTDTQSVVPTQTGIPKLYLYGALGVAFILFISRIQK